MPKYNRSFGIISLILIDYAKSLISFGIISIIFVDYAKSVSQLINMEWLIDAAFCITP